MNLGNFFPKILGVLKSNNQNLNLKSVCKDFIIVQIASCGLFSFIGLGKIIKRDSSYYPNDNSNNNLDDTLDNTLDSTLDDDLNDILNDDSF